MPAGFRKLPKEFYLRRAVIVARELIGKYIFRRIDDKFLSGIIVEAEAYTGRTDPAAHSYRGKTPRNAVMFEDGGLAYVYFTYGNHYCLNAVTCRKGTPSAVLIRAVEPVDGIEIMKRNRGTDVIHNLTSGPGKLTKAFMIGLELNGASLNGDDVFIAEKIADNRKMRVVKSKRIGITRNTEKPYRFFEKDNKFVSHTPAKLLMRK